MKVLQAVILLCLSIATGACGDTIAFASAPREVVKPIFANAFLVSDPTTQKHYSSGSAIILAPGYALTAAHVIQTDVIKQGNSNIGTAIFIQQPSEAVPVTVVKIDKDKDLALIKGNFDCPCATIHTGAIDVDTKVITIGYPLYGLYKLQVLSEGALQGKYKTKLVTTAQAAPGSSGGGVFIKTLRGYELISVVEGIAASPGEFQAQIHAWLVFSTPTSEIMQFLQGSEAEFLINY